ncbi:hypothetical protein [Streptomyces sp. NPDC002133]|uniref:hypothetical protein n=1 Tax=Streptomyces sp. NPDC002133 TaxID=3154409 RepID=UPI003318376D
MALYIVIPTGLMALLATLSGVAALGWGWLPPWQRRHTFRPHLVGWADLVFAAALVAQLVGGMLRDSGHIHSGVTAAGIVMMLCGILLTVLAQRPPQGR